MTVKITSETFTLEDGAWESEGITESTSPCRFFYRKDGSFSLSYEEKAEGAQGTTRLSYDREAKTLTLSCTGDRRYTAVFGGEKCDFVYAVSAFAFDACAETESLELQVSEAGGCIRLTYLLTLSDIPRRVCLTAELG